MSVRSNSSFYVESCSSRSFLCFRSAGLMWLRSLYCRSHKGTCTAYPFAAFVDMWFGYGQNHKLVETLSGIIKNNIDHLSNRECFACRKVIYSKIGYGMRIQTLLFVSNTCNFIQLFFRGYICVPRLSIYAHAMMKPASTIEKLIAKVIDIKTGVLQNIEKLV